MPSGPGVSKANLNRINEQMTKAGVEAILGKSTDTSFYVGQTSESNGTTSSELWRNPDGSFAQVDFMGESVVRKHWNHSTETIVEKLLRWISPSPPPARSVVTFAFPDT